MKMMYRWSDSPGTGNFAVPINLKTAVIDVLYREIGKLNYCVMNRVMLLRAIGDL